ncbi:hypothetical protein KAZ66_05360 [Candidatus Woesebacteria bacterium]|nr:hypothetical protein [Candidatus Woesebacteria bacterium]
MLDFLFTKTPLLFLVQDLWRDEAFSYVLSVRSIPDILHLTAGDFNPPFYYILLHFWMNIFGSSEIAMRSLSLIFFLATLYILYDTCLYVLKIPHKRTAVYFLLFLFNPFLLTYAFEARMYMMVTFFITLSYFSLWTGRKKLYIISIVLGLYTHYLSIFIFGIQTFMYLFAFWYKNRQKNFFYTMKTHIVSFSHFIIPGLIFLPWVMFMLLSHNFSDGGFWIITPPLKDFWYMPFVLYTGYERVFGQYYHGMAGYTDFHSTLNTLLWLILLIPLVLTIYKNRKSFKDLHSSYLFLNSKKMEIILWAFFPPLIIFILSFISQPLYLPRYFIFAAPGLLLLFVVCFEYILQANNKMLRYSLAIVAVLGIFLTTYTKTFNTLNLRYHSKRSVKNFYNEIKMIKQPTDLIYLDSELDYHLAQYYFGIKEKIYIYNKTYAGIPQYVGKVLISEDAVTQILPSYPIRAFVVYYHWYNIRSIE